MKYHVQLQQRIWEECYVEIEADTAEEAKQIALTSAGLNWMFLEIDGDTRRVVACVPNTKVKA